MSSDPRHSEHVLVIGPTPLAETLAERLDPHYHVAYGDPALGDLIKFLRVEGTRYDAVLFLDHTYPVTRDGLKLVSNRAVLIPLIESPEALAGHQPRTLIRLPRALGFRSVHEQTMVQQALGNHEIPHEIVGPDLDDLAAFERLIAHVIPRD